MCGIVGVFDPAGQGIAEQDLIVMRDRMVSRGPDDAGLFVHRDSGLFVGLGHRRLSIIDLSPLGRQPMSNCRRQALDRLQRRNFQLQGTPTASL